MSHGAVEVAEPPPPATRGSDLTPPSDRRARRGTKVHQDRRAALFFLTPWLLGLVFISAGPILISLYLSFTDYSLIGAPEWVGLDNYVEMFTADPRFLSSLKVTFIYVLVSVPLQLVFALFLAMILDRGIRGLAIYRSVYYLPSLIGSSVAVAILWRQIFGVEGLVNQLLAIFGIDGPGWVSHPDYALWTLILLNVWTFGSPMVIFLAGLRQIPHEQYEAAAVDGASPLQRFLRITLPLLTPIIFFNLVLQTIKAFQSFTQAFVVSGGSGGPADSTLFYTLYLYQEGFGNFDMGYASALAWFLLVVVAGFTLVNFLASKYWVFYGDE